jgi:hypothetical protein
VCNVCICVRACASVHVYSRPFWPQNVFIIVCLTFQSPQTYGSLNISYVSVSFHVFFFSHIYVVDWVIIIIIFVALFSSSSIVLLHPKHIQWKKKTEARLFFLGSRVYNVPSLSPSIKTAALNSVNVFFFSNQSRTQFKIVTF